MPHSRVEKRSAVILTADKMSALPLSLREYAVDMAGAGRQETENPRQHAARGFSHFKVESVQKKQSLPWRPPRHAVPQAREIWLTEMERLTEKNSVRVPFREQ